MLTPKPFFPQQRLKTLHGVGAEAPCFDDDVAKTFTDPFISSPEGSGMYGVSTERSQDKEEVVRFGTDPLVGRTWRQVRVACEQLQHEHVHCGCQR